MSRRWHFDEDPSIYVSEKFRLYESHWNNVLEAECTDNWEQLNGYDQFIRKLKVEGRSNLQTPTLWPAVEGRVSQNMARLKSREPILAMEATDKTDPFAIIKALKIQEWIRHILERQEWLQDIAVMMTAAETFPIVWLKCRVGELAMTPSEQYELELAMGLPPGMMAGATRMVPEFELLAPSQVFFDWRAKSRHAFVEKFQVPHLSLDEVYDMFGSDMVRKIEDYESQEPRWIREWEEAAGRRTWMQWGEPRYRLAEGWIKAHNSDGTVQTKVVKFFPDVFTDSRDTNAGLLVDIMDPPIGFDPFISVVARRLPFHFMGKSTVSLGKAYQRESAVLTNMAIDILGYTAAPPILVHKDSVDNPAQLQFSSRSLWMLNDAAFPPQALHVPTPNADFLNAMRAQMDQSLNHITAAYEGVTGQSPTRGGETLGQYRDRTASGQSRVDLSLLNYAAAIAGIGWRYWYYLREFPRHILGRTPLPVQTPLGPQTLEAADTNVAAMVRVKGLTEFEDDEIKKIEFDRFMERVSVLPIVAANPQVQMVLAGIYANQHIQDADVLQALHRAMMMPLDPMLLSGQGGNNPPLTRFSPGTGDAERRVSAFGSSQAGGG